MRTGEACTVALALATSCCAGQPGPEAATVTQPSEPTGPTGPTGPTTAGEPGEVVFAAIDAEEAARRLWPRPGPTAFVPASAAEATALAGLIGRMIAEPEATPATLTADAAAAGFLIEGWEVAGQRWLVARERADRRGGGGAYLVRVGAAAPVILQAPHGFFDIGTERIALALAFEAGDWPRALFVNTAHRYLGVDGIKKKRADSPADPCHSEGHLLAVATAAAIERMPQAEVVQLHGFGDDAAEENGGAFAAIVSGGTRPASARSRIVAERLRTELGAQIGLFPEDTERLGATTNVQGRAIRAFNERTGAAATFVHVELSAAMRTQLQADAALRRRLAAALRSAASGT